MIILDAVDKDIEVVLAAAVTTNQLDIVAAYVDIGSANQMVSTLFGNDLVTNDTTPVQAVKAPDSTNARQVKSMTIYNADTVAATVTVQLNNNATLRLIVVKSLAPGETLQYTEGIGWEVLEIPTIIVATSFTGQQLAQAVNVGLGPDSIFTAAAKTKVTSINISNQSGADSTYSLWIDTDGAVATDATNLALDVPILAGSVVLMSELTFWLEAGGEISVGQGDASAITWTIDGEVLT